VAAVALGIDQSATAVVFDAAGWLPSTLRIGGRNRPNSPQYVIGAPRQTQFRGECTFQMASKAKKGGSTNAHRLMLLAGV